MKFKSLVSKLNKREGIKILFLMQASLPISIMVYFGLIKWNLIDEQYNPITTNVMLIFSLLLSGLIGIASIYIFNEIVGLIEKEKEYEMQALQIEQMQEANDLLRSQKHDFSNNLQILWGMLSLGDMEKARDYLERYTDAFKIDEEELIELGNISCSYLHTLLLNKAYKCKDMGIETYYNIKPSIFMEGYNPVDIVRILANLFDNAIYEINKLKDDNKFIAVDIFCDDKDYIFRITNEGTVISEKIKDKIFKKGFTTKGKDGSGYGLYNVRKLVEKNYGTICVESDIKIGTRFTVTIPKNSVKNGCYLKSINRG